MAVDESALERVRDEIIVAVGAIVRESIREAVRESEQRIRAEIAEAIAASEARMRREIVEAIAASEARLEARLEARIEASAAETRRHTGVVGEDLKSKIALVAEGLITLTERLAAKMQDGFDILDRRLLRVEARLLSPGQG